MSRPTMRDLERDCAQRLGIINEQICTIRRLRAEIASLRRDLADRDAGRDPGDLTIRHYNPLMSSAILRAALTRNTGGQ